MSLVADGGQFRDPILERRIGGVDDAILYRLVEALQLRFRLGDPLVKSGDVSAPAVIPFLRKGRVICGVNRTYHLGGCSEVATFSVAWSLSGRPLQSASSMG